MNGKVKVVRLSLIENGSARYFGTLYLAFADKDTG